MATIPLTKGFVALVDDEDYEALSHFRWHACETGSGVYARRSTGDGRTTYMHREIVRPRPGFEVDHANRDGLDNRRANLREATSSQNKANRSHSRIRRISPFRGVTFHRASGRWRAELRGKSLGYFPDPKSAADVYDAAAREAFGPFAHVNTPPQEAPE